ncbi:MAG: YbjQ family protein [Prevotella sp.]|jgi:uncharacterized protein YbjQ (UPF0145 family)|nr:YbjQ family protein [Prevotella sp.]
MERFIITTTGNIESCPIKDYLGVVNSNIVIGTNLFSDIAASFTDIFGGNSGTYQNKMDLMYKSAKDSLTKKAKALGANAIVGFRIDFDEISGKGKGMLMISATGTACLIENRFKNDIKEEKIVYPDDLINKLETKKNVEYVKENGINFLSQPTWESIMRDPQLSLVEKMLKLYYSDGTDTKRVIEYIRKIDPSLSIPYLYNLFPKYKDTLVLVIKSCKLFDAKSVTKLIDDDLHYAIKLLETEKEFYTCEDLKDMQILLAKLDDLPNKGQITNAKLGMFGKEQDVYICPNGHKNDINNKYCSKCGENIQGITYKEENIISEFRSKVQMLSNMILGK